ncbi:hypothetical protein K9M79_05325 [Candidatus Woesearchaeota archaeon]|nr:hypothetical protein [Candidatus Woesearchaeota archaeon]
MIALGNREFIIGMKMCGVQNSHVIERREECTSLIKELSKDEFIIANASIVDMVPELKSFRNLATLPDDVKEFDSIDDLKYIIKTAVGIELEVV